MILSMEFTDKRHLQLKITVVLSALTQLSHATLVSNASVACPGDTVSFTCTLSGSVLRWDVVPPPGSGFMSVSSSGLSSVGQMEDVGSSPGFMFQAVVTDSSGGSLTSTLTTVTEVESIEGTNVSCVSEVMRVDPLTILLADPPSPPLNPTLTSFQNGTSTSVVTLQWSPPSSPGGVDVSYVLTTSPTPVSGSPVTAQSNSVEITVSYNIPYNVTVRADNCAGSSGDTVVEFELVNCFQPSAADGVTLPNIGTTTEGSSFMITCSSPNNNVMETSVCGSDGNWSPDPSGYVCPTAQPPTAPPVSCGSPGSLSNGNVDVGGHSPPYPLGSIITFRCDDGLFPSGLMNSTCVDVGGEGVWVEDPAGLICRSMPVNCSVPSEPVHGDILDYCAISTIEGSMVTFQCDPGFSPEGEMTATCNNSGLWTNDPAGLVCTMNQAQTPVALTTGAAVGITAVVTFIVSVFIGFLAGLLVMYMLGRNKLHKENNGQLSINPPPPQEQPPPPGPVYEEVSTPKENIELETNLAYGPVRR